VLGVSTDGGQTFVDKGTPFETPLLYTSTPMIKPNPLVAGDIWVTFGKNDGSIGALYRSIDEGDSFQQIATVDAAYRVAFGKGPSPSVPAIYLFGRVGGTSADTMYRSDDLAQTWTPISDPTTEQFGLIQYLEGDMKVDGLVYAALAGRGILYGTSQH
jgi:xyloglucan-specific exo-beta-1,4-glucanase